MTQPPRPSAPAAEAAPPVRADAAARDQDLIELLRKAHREELLTLASILRISPAGMKQGTLQRAIDRQLRLKGAHDVANILLRDGKGPPYAEVLVGLCKRVGVDPGATVEDAELALLKYHIRTRWKEMPPGDRERLWQQMQVSAPMPGSIEEGLALAERKHLQRLGYVAGSAFLVGRLVPLPGCLSLLVLARPKDEVVLPAVLEVGRLRQAIRYRVTVGVVGSPSSGKDAAIKAIFGVDSGNVDPVAGSTKTVEITRLPRATALYIVNTPGLGDVVESVTEEARQVLDHIDVFVYVVNAQGGVQAREKSDCLALRKRGRPVLVVVNKVDTLLPADRERYLADAREKIGAGERDFLAAAYDPLPQLAEAPIGVDETRAWVEARLAELGKDTNELPWRAKGETP